MSLMPCHIQNKKRGKREPTSFHQETLITTLMDKSVILTNILWFYFNTI